VDSALPYPDLPKTVLFSFNRADPEGHPMRYEDIPKLSSWKGDAYSIHKVPPIALIAKIDDLLQKYEQAFSPMSKRNLLADLDRACKEWKPPQPRNPALEALADVVKRRLSYDMGGRKYSSLVCIAYSVKTGGFDSANRVKYSGQLDDEQDMRARVAQMRAAVACAKGLLPAKLLQDAAILKVFMAPEFFFRGRYGAYTPDVAAQIMPLLQSGDGGTNGANFKDWLFVLGTAISASIDAVTWCFTCGSNANIVFKKDPFDPNKTKPECKIAPAHQVGEGIFGATIDNVAFIQKGSESFLVAKEFISGIDFRNEGTGGFVMLKDEGLRKKLKALPTQGATNSRIHSKFTDERMGGGVFNFDGITFGMISAENLQIQLLPSAGMDIRNHRTIPDGIAFNVDGVRGDSCVQINDATKTKPAIAQSLPVPGQPGKIEIYNPILIPYT
jgi:hypothetical protein